MGFLSKLKDAKPEQVGWATNAPGHWPPIFSDPLPHPGADTDDLRAHNQLIFLSGFNQCLEKANCGCKFTAFAPSRLTMDGLLSSPVSSFEVTDNGNRIMAFFYPEATEATGAHFAHASLVLQQLGEPEPVYYAPEMLPMVPPAGALVEYLSFEDLAPIERVPVGDYSMWYATAEQPNMKDSVTLAYIQRAYEAMSGYEPHPFGGFMRQFEMVDANTGPLLLPDEMIVVPLSGPEHRPLLMSASREKGIRFHLRDDTPVGYRDAFWKLYATFCEMLRQRFVEKGIPTHGEEGDALIWFNNASAVALDYESKGQSARFFGGIPVK